MKSLHGVIAIAAAATAQQAYTGDYSTVWIDDSCSPYRMDAVFAEALNMARLGASVANNFMNGNADAQRLFETVFGADNSSPMGATYRGWIRDSLTQLSAYALVGQIDQAAVRIYCDQDARWEQATDDIVPGNSKRNKRPKAWYDPISRCIEDFNKPEGFNLIYKDPTPGCREAIPNFTRAQTYTRCQEKLVAATKNKVSTITVCNGDVQAALKTLGDIQAKTPDWTKFGKFNVLQSPMDAAAILSTTLLHEMMHTRQFAKVDEGQGIPGITDRAYGWNNIKNKAYAGAFVNADSFAYLGLGAWLLDTNSRGQAFAIGKDGKIYYRGQVPASQSRREFSNMAEIRGFLEEME